MLKESSKGLDKVYQHYQGKDVNIVSHGSVINTILRLYLMAKSDPILQNYLMFVLVIPINKTVHGEFLLITKLTT
ncbi:hypothetical protein AB990_11015 [Alkalihalobacillus pseudalcaliphilus]|nr:hypothetical protein AB990_11015 [Alkalihalobacillus pseudalcaliphilus]